MHKIKEHLKMLSVYLAIGIMPLLIQLELATNLVEWQSVYPGDLSGDLSIEIKYRFLLLLGVISVITLLFGFKKVVETIKNSKVAMIFMVMIIFFSVSTFLSDNFMTSLFGGPHIREGLIMWIIYLLLFLQTLTFSDEKTNKILFKLFIFTTVINGIIVILQYYKIDIWNYEFIRNMLIPDKYLEYANFGRIVDSGTMYNPNFVGSFMALVIPFYYVIGRNKEKWIPYASLFLFSYAVLLSSRSTAGILAVMVALFIFVIKDIKVKIKDKFHITIFIGMIILSSVFSTSIASNIRDLSSPLTQQTDDFIKDRLFIEGIDIKDNVMVISVNDKPNLVILNFESGIVFADELGNKLDITGDDGNYTFVNSDYEYVYANFYSEELMSINFGQKRMPVATIDNTFVLLNQDLSPIPTLMVNKYGFENYERIGSGRGYIWSRSIPLIANKPLLGTGLNTYVLEFPQYDIVGKINFFNNINMIVDKPHNMYLMLLVSTGMYGFLFYMLFTYLVVKEMYMNTDIRKYIIIVLSYGIVMFFNDSMIFTTAPYFILLGSILSIKRVDENIELVSEEIIDIES